MTLWLIFGLVRVSNYNQQKRNLRRILEQLTLDDQTGQKKKKRKKSHSLKRPKEKRAKENVGHWYVQIHKGTNQVGNEGTVAQSSQ